MRVTLDSNVWEKVFGSDTPECTAIRGALAHNKFQGFLCEATFRIEAVRRVDRFSYFAHPHMDVTFPQRAVMLDGVPHLHFMSIGPADYRHPGLPDVQRERLKLALSSGIRLMRGLAWTGLPSPPELSDPGVFVQETENERAERERRQVLANVAIWSREVGKKIFDNAGGWQAIEDGSIGQTRFKKACAEWADGELVAAHIAYRNDLLCTEDEARGAGISVFDESNRRWLASEHGLQFVKLNELADMLAS